MTIEITRVRLSPPDSRQHEHITHLECYNHESGAGPNWETRQAVVRYIDGGGAMCTGTPPGTRVVVIREDGTDPYARTVANGVQTDNLLQLPRNRENPGIPGFP